MKEIAPALQKEFSYSNRMAIPELRKIVVNMGVGEATQNVKLLDGATQDLVLITGQKPIVNRARRSIAAFKLRQGVPIGCSVTLRGRRMYEFLDRLLNIALPRRQRTFKVSLQRRLTGGETTPSESGIS